MGRLFREFAVILSASILVSMVVKLTTTPMTCAALLRPAPAQKNPSPLRYGQADCKSICCATTGRLLAWTLRHQPIALLALLYGVALNVHCYGAIAKGFFPQQDTGRVNSNIRTDPAVESATGFTGGGRRNTAKM